MRWLAYNCVSLALAIGAVMLAFHDKSGWGWMLVGAIACCVVPKGD
jgi:hypothetical protein